MEELIANITDAQSGETTITITDNIAIGDAAAIPTITSRKNITLTSNGNYQIYRTEANMSPGLSACSRLTAEI